MVFLGQTFKQEGSDEEEQDADWTGHRYFVQLILEGTSYQKPRNQPGNNIVGLDLGPATLAIVPREGEARLVLLSAFLAAYLDPANPIPSITL